MRYKLFYITFVLLLTSCVSKKKYNALKQQHEQFLNEKVGFEDALNKMSTENDNLKKQIALLDSLLVAARIKNNSVNAGSTDVHAKVKTSSTLSKAVEYDTKALYIYSIPAHIFWPAGIKADKFLIGVIGESKLNVVLASYMYGKTIHRLPAIVEPYIPAPGKFYHMVFIAEGKQKEFYKIQKGLKDQPVLLIVENQYPEKAGAHISIYAEGDKVKFKINKKQIERTGLKVSETLVKLGQSTQ